MSVPHPFPPQSAFDRNEVPDGYPLSCPFCGQLVPGVRFCMSEDCFCCDGPYGLTPVILSPDGLFTLIESDQHSLIVSPSVIHQCHQ
jgi:hypothetical protein